MAVIIVITAGLPTFIVAVAVAGRCARPAASAATRFEAIAVVGPVLVRYAVLNRDASIHDSLFFCSRLGSAEKD